MKDIVQNSVWEKAKNFIEDKYGKTINFKSFNLSLKKDLYFIEGDDLIIPLHREKSSLGEVVVKNGQFLTQDQKLEITDFVKFLIEPHVYNQHLVIKEQQVKAQLNINEFHLLNSTYSTNIYTLYSGSQSSSEDFKIESENKSNRLISNIIHIKSANASTRRKVAFKLHEMCENQLFISYTDLSRSLLTVHDFIQLGQTTLFIDNLDSLQHHEFNLIQEASENSQCEIFFVFSSHKSEDDINALQAQFSLTNKLNSFIFEVDRIPVSQQTNTDILELLFFDLDQSQES